MLTKQAESILQELGLHYRVVELCTGDLSFSAAKCYDLEIWASEKDGLRYLHVAILNHFKLAEEILGIELLNNEVRYLHTLNGSGVATPRLMAALIETYQNEKGEIIFPEKVANFLGVREVS